MSYSYADYHHHQFDHLDSQPLPDPEYPYQYDLPQPRQPEYMEWQSSQSGLTAAVQPRRATCWDPPWARQPTGYQQPPTHLPYQARQPTCWDPPWSRQTTAYQQPPRHRPNSCWDLDQQPLAGRETTIWPHPYFQNPSSGEHSTRTYQQQHPGQPRQPTCWDRPSQHQSVGYQHFDQPSSRQPSCWDPPVNRASQGYPSYDQPPARHPSCGDPKAHRAPQKPRPAPSFELPSYTAFEQPPYAASDAYAPPHAADSRCLSRPHLRHDPSSSSLHAATAVPLPPPQRSSSSWSPTSHCRSAAPLAAAAVVPPPSATISLSCSPDIEYVDEASEVANFEYVKEVERAVEEEIPAPALEGKASINKLERASFMEDRVKVEEFNVRGKGRRSPKQMVSRESCPKQENMLRVVGQDLIRWEHAIISHRPTSLDADARLIPPRKDTPCVDLFTAEVQDFKMNLEESLDRWVEASGVTDAEEPQSKVDGQVYTLNQTPNTFSPFHPYLMSFTILFMEEMHATIRFNVIALHSAPSRDPKSTKIDDHILLYTLSLKAGGEFFVNLSFARMRGEECSSSSEKVDQNKLLRAHCLIFVTLKELVKHSLPIGGFLKKDHADEKELLSVQDFFRYTDGEVKRLLLELDKDGVGQVSLEDLDIAMANRNLPKRYAKEIFKCTRRCLFSMSSGWNEFLSVIAFDPGGEISKLLLSSTMFVASWFPP